MAQTHTPPFAASDGGSVLRGHHVLRYANEVGLVGATWQGCSIDTVRDHQLIRVQPISLHDRRVDAPKAGAAKLRERADPRAARSASRLAQDHQCDSTQNGDGRQNQTDAEVLAQQHHAAEGRDHRNAELNGSGGGGL